jgi:hypothetical protein
MAARLRVDARSHLRPNLPACRAFLAIGTPRFELGTSSPPDRARREPPVAACRETPENCRCPRGGRPADSPFQAPRAPPSAYAASDIAGARLSSCPSPRSTTRGVGDSLPCRHGRRSRPSAQPGWTSLRMPARMPVPAKRTWATAPPVHPRSLPHAAQRRREASASRSRGPLFQGRVAGRYRRFPPRVRKRALFREERCGRVRRFRFRLAHYPLGNLRPSTGDFPHGQHGHMPATARSCDR